MRLLVEAVVMAVAAVSFCLMLAAFGMIVRGGGWQPALQLTAEDGIEVVRAQLRGERLRLPLAATPGTS
jgi:hypothetical protein